MMSSVNDQTVLIIDGPDTTGKTNIVQALSRRINVPSFKNSGEHAHFAKRDTEYFTNAAKYIDTYMAAFLGATGTSCIFDRAWPSEYCYPAVFGRPRNMDVLQRLDDAWAQLGTRIIVPFRTSYSGIKDKVYDHITEDNLRQLDDLYAEFCEWTQCKTLRLNVDDEDIHRELDDIIQFIEQH